MANNNFRGKYRRFLIDWDKQMFAAIEAQSQYERRTNTNMIVHMCRTYLRHHAPQLQDFSEEDYEE